MKIFFIPHFEKKKQDCAFKSINLDSEVRTLNDEVGISFQFSFVAARYSLLENFLENFVFI